MGGVCARRRSATGGRRGAPPKPRSAYGKRARRPPTGGVLNITAAVWSVGFHWWRSDNKKRTQNVSEYMLVLALCLVDLRGHDPVFSADLEIFVPLTRL